MVQILEDQPNFGQLMARGGGQALGSALSGGLEGYIQKKQGKREDEVLKRLTGQDLSGLSPDMKKMFVESLFKSSSGKEGQLLSGAEQGLETIQRQKERLASGHLGPKISFLPGQESKLFSAISPEGRKVRAGYEQAGKELIQLAATLPIRNRQEFETLAEKLYDPTLTEAEISGLLEEMESHIKDAIKFSGSKKQIFSNDQVQGKGKAKFDVSNPEHKARRDQVLKKTGGDREKAQQVLLKEFEL